MLSLLDGTGSGGCTRPIRKGRGILHNGADFGAVQRREPDGSRLPLLPVSSGREMAHREARLAPKAARIAFQRQRRAAERAFGEQPADDPMAAAAAGAVIMLVDAVHDVVAPQERIGSRFVRGGLAKIGMH